MQFIQQKDQVLSKIILYFITTECQYKLNSPFDDTFVWSGSCELCTTFLELSWLVIICPKWLIPAWPLIVLSVEFFSSASKNCWNRFMFIFGWYDNGAGCESSNSEIWSDNYIFTYTLIYNYSANRHYMYILELAFHKIKHRQSVSEMTSNRLIIESNSYYTDSGTYKLSAVKIC